MLSQSADILVLRLTLPCCRFASFVIPGGVVWTLVLWACLPRCQALFAAIRSRADRGLRLLSRCSAHPRGCCRRVVRWT